jgi:hypothetical protein
VIVTFNYCPDCESHHLGSRCGMTFAERLRTVQVDGAALETRTKRDYYDVESVHDTFGEDAEDRMMDATKGIGAIKRGADGKLWRKDRRSGDIVRAEQKLDTLLAADTETSDVDPSLDSD